MLDNSVINDMQLNQLSPILSTDLIEKKDMFSVHVDLPGIRKEDLVVNVNAENIVIKGERKAVHEENSDYLHHLERSYGKVQRTIPIPRGVDSSLVTASFENGTLEITLPKAEVSESEATRTLDISDKKQSA